MTNTANRPDGAAVLAAALFDLSERAMRDAARLAVIAQAVTRCRFDSAHKLLALYVARRDGAAYGVVDVNKALQTIEELCPEIGDKAARNRKAKAVRDEHWKEVKAAHAQADAAIANGMSHQEASKRYLWPVIERPSRAKPNVNKPSNVVRFPGRGRSA